MNKVAGSGIGNSSAIVNNLSPSSSQSPLQTSLSSSSSSNLSNTQSSSSSSYNTSADTNSNPEFSPAAAAAAAVCHLANLANVYAATGGNQPPFVGSFDRVSFSILTFIFLLYLIRNPSN